MQWIELPSDLRKFSPCADICRKNAARKLLYSDGFLLSRANKILYEQIFPRGTFWRAVKTREEEKKFTKKILPLWENECRNGSGDTRNFRIGGGGGSDSR